MNEPKIIEYTSCQEFLKDYYLFRKLSSRSFSYEKWARELSYSHRSNLRLILKGDRKIPVVLEKCLEDKIFSEVRDKEYFKLLCLLQRTANFEKRGRLLAKAQQVRSARLSVVVKGDSAAYQTLEYIYMTVLLGFEDIDRSTEGVARRMRQESSEVLRALEVLEEMGFIERRLGGRGKLEWVSKGDYLIFQDNVGSQRLAEFHRQSFMKAMAAQVGVPQGKRRFDSLLLPLDRKAYGEVAQEIQEFLDRLFYRYNENRLKGKELYQIQIGTFLAM